jgi:hypothetical protein
VNPEQVNRRIASVYRRYAKDRDQCFGAWDESRKARAMGRFFSHSTLAMAEEQQCAAGLNNLEQGHITLKR